MSSSCSPPEVVTLDSSTEEKKSASSSSGVSFDLLHSCHSVALEKWGKKAKNRLADLKALLPAPVSRDSAFVSALHAQLEDRIRAEAGEAIKERADDWGLRDKLDRLDAIVARQEAEEGDRDSAWRPSGLPLDNQSAHDVDSVREAADSLERDVVHTVEKEVGELMSEVSSLRAAIARNEAEVEEFSRAQSARGDAEGAGIARAVMEPK